MEAKSEEKSDDCFLKIDTFWSEAKGSYENTAIKEEVVLDPEPECIFFAHENSISHVDVEHRSKVLSITEKNVSCFNNAISTSKQHLKKKIKKKNVKIINDNSEKINNEKLICLHDTKNFKIVKRRLRCGNCKTLICPECCKVTIHTLRNHFSGSDVNNVKNYLCKICKLAFHSLCALQAHIRIHTMSTPYVCPDCGLIYNNIYFLILHLINKCYHVYKIVRYKCKICPSNYFTSDKFMQHIQEQHIEYVFRCFYCSSIFNNSNEFNCHMNNFHQKQKFLHLNYFQCSLCFKMVIPRFMYEEHIAQHCENSESFEIDYQCLCGYIYTSIGAFRDHVQHCNKKGMLPHYWSFLQNKLKTENFQSKITNTKTDKKELKNENFLLYNNKISNEQNDSNSKDCEIIETSTNNLKSSVVSTNTVSPSHCDSFETVYLNEMCNNMSDNIDTSEIDHSKITVNRIPDVVAEENCTKQIIKKFVTVENKTKNTEENNFQIEEEPEQKDRISSKENHFQNEKEPEPKNSISTKENQFQIEEKPKKKDHVTSSIFYSYIPCDHLGYLNKAQCLDSTRKDLQVRESSSPIKFVEKVSSNNPNLFHFVTELDEKTGLITKKKIPMEDLRKKEENCIYNYSSINKNRDNDCSEKNEKPNSFDIMSNIYSHYKTKFKLGSSFFTCPFCIVLFPKKNSTFQQFRLHLESYHPDAALNVNINESEYTKIKKNTALIEEKKRIAFSNWDNVKAQNKLKNNEHLTEDSEKESFSKSTFWKNQLSLSSEEQVVEKKSKSEQINPIILQNCVKEVCLENTENHSNDENFNKMGQKEKNHVIIKSLHEKKIYKGEKENLPKIPDLVFKDHSQTKEKNVCWTMKLSLQKSDILNEELQSSVLEENSTANSDKSENDENYKRTTFRKGKKLENEKKNAHSLEAENEKRILVATDFGEDCENYENLKNSNCNTFSGIPTEVSESMDMANESKAEEKYRREGEVWSQFYESLMLAEKLKTNKKKKFLSHPDGKKKIVVSDYLTKRIVKKPIRYRESSDSEYSGLGNENSDSGSEFLSPNNYESNFRSNENGEVEKNLSDDRFHKKQKLLKKLKDVDSKFLDYLFDLITKKEKHFELYKKISTINTNRYNQDLRSYRKKVLNGIKRRGRPNKLIRYQELLKKKSHSRFIDNKNLIFKDLSYQSIQKKNSEFSSESNKIGERKRGRPRKIVDPNKVKERRRSDKEVNFIEKNFEREENDSSTSKRKRKLSSKLQYYKKINLTEEKDDFSSGQVIINKPADSNRKFSCAVCKELFLEDSDFREHILMHRMEENTYQCMECGECFVVRPSLEKHLHAFHKIKNTERYITENQCCNIKKEVTNLDSEPLKENQCKVCKDQFDRPLDLTKHFRIHGMAFLKEFKKEGKVNK